MNDKNLGTKQNGTNSKQKEKYRKDVKIIPRINLKYNNPK